MSGAVESVLDPPPAHSFRMHFTAIIPARLASTRFPGKALADLGGKPMIVRVAERARESGADSVYVATDHRDIADAVERAGFQAVMTRARIISREPTGSPRSRSVSASRPKPSW